VMRMPALKFIMVDAASAVITVTLMVGIGFWGGSSIQILQKDAKRIEYIGILILAILLTGWIVYKYFKNRKVR